MQKNSFVLQTRLNAIVTKMSDKQAGVLFKSILNYAENGVLGNFEDNAVSIAFEFVRQDLDYTAQKYAETCARRAASGRLGGRPKKQMLLQESKKSKCFFEKANESKQKHNDTDTDTDNDNDTNTSINTSDSILIKKVSHFHKCDCVSQSTKEQCLRKATYCINGKYYCNQHSRDEIAKLENCDIKSRFKKPTLAEITAYCAERKNTINPQTFFDFYEAKGWKIGTSPMKDWRAAVRTWESKQKENRNAGIDYNKQDADFSKYAGLGRVFGK